MYRLFFIVLISIFTLSAFAQRIESKKCKSCGKPLAQCQYGGNHPFSNSNSVSSAQPGKDNRVKVSFSGTPELVFITIDGSGKSSNYKDFLLTPGTHNVKYEREGYVEKIVSITVPQSRSFVVKYKLDQLGLTSTTASSNVSQRSDYNEISSKNIITVKGRVTTKSGRPIFGRVVEIIRDGQSKSTSVFTDKDGYFTLKDIFSTDEVRVYDLKAREYQKRRANSGLNFQVEE